MAGPDLSAYTFRQMFTPIQNIPGPPKVTGGLQINLSTVFRPLSYYITAASGTIPGNANGMLIQALSQDAFIREDGDTTIDGTAPSNNAFSLLRNGVPYLIQTRAGINQCYLSGKGATALCWVQFYTGNTGQPVKPL